MFEAELFEIQTEEVEDGGIEVVERVDVLDRLLAKFVGDAVADSGLHACAGHPAGEAIGVMVAAFGAFLEEGHTAKLGAPDDEGVLQEPALFEVPNEGGGGLVEDLRVDVILRFEITMAVPVQFAPARIGAIEELHEADTLFDEAAGEDAVFGKGGFVRVLRVIGTVAFQDVCGLGAEVVDLGHAELHAGSEFVAGDAGGELAIARMGFEMAGVHSLQERARSLIGVRRDSRSREMANGIFGTHRRALERSGKEAGSPVVGSVLRHPARVGECDIRGQLLAHAAERIRYPRAE